jgi:hypothetical protein
MRTLSMLLITFVAVAAVFLSVTLGQAPNRANQGAAVRPPAPAPSVEPPEGWKRCPRCQNNQDRRDAWAKYGIDSHANNPRDLTGVWGYDGVPFGREQTPILTEWAKQVIAGRGGFTPAARTTPEVYKCDPPGYVRLFQYNYGFEFIQLPDRVLQFFELTHSWRTIWTDGRKLPAEPPEPHFMGWNVGHWEGETFVIEANGFDGRAWFSDEMRVIEKYRRPNYGTLEVELTVIDPKAYTKPLTGHDTIKLVPDTELSENFCAPSDAGDFADKVVKPLTGSTTLRGAQAPR